MSQTRITKMKAFTQLSQKWAHVQAYVQKKQKTHLKFIQKIQQDATVYQNLLFHIYMKPNMFRATHRPSSGA